MSKVLHANVVCCLMYAMICTRPDLAYATSLISRFMSKLGKEHWNAVKWVFRYVRRTFSFGLLYKRAEDCEDKLVGYCDSDFCGDLDKRRSLTGYCFTLFGNVINWKASLLSIVALSTTETEFMALTEATKETLWLQGLTGEFGVKQKIVLIFSDCQSAIHLTKNRRYHERTKHIDVRLYFIREVVGSNKVMIKKVYTDDNPTDFVTKPVTTIKFKKCMNLISVAYLDQS